MALGEGKILLLGVGGEVEEHEARTRGDGRWRKQCGANYFEVAGFIGVVKK